MREFEPRFPHNKMRKTNATNQELQELITEMQSKGTDKLLGRIATDLSRSTRTRREVNLSRLNKFTKENEIVVVPGKVLGGGEIEHKITISAFKFSTGALAKLEKSGSKIVPLKELIAQDIKGKRIRIIG